MARQATSMKLFIGKDITLAESVLTSVDDMLYMVVNRRKSFEDICKDSSSAECVCPGGSINGKIVKYPFTDGRITVLPDDQGITIWGRDPKDVLSFCLLYNGKDLSDFPEILRAYQNFTLPEDPIEKPSFRNYVFSVIRRKLCSC